MFIIDQVIDFTKLSEIAECFDNAETDVNESFRDILSRYHLNHVNMRNFIHSSGDLFYSFCGA